jgi:hypothetical protein
LKCSRLKFETIAAKGFIAFVLAAVSVSEAVLEKYSVNIFPWVCGGLSFAAHKFKNINKLNNDCMLNIFLKSGSGLPLILMGLEENKISPSIEYYAPILLSVLCFS